MARNGSGTYTLPAGNPVTSGGVITDTWANTTLSDIGTELTNSLARDGQAPATGNIPMGGNKITGLGSGTTQTDGANVGQVQSSASQWITSISGTETITGSVAPSLTAYAAGQTFRFVSAGANTGAATLNINSLGAKALTKSGSTALAAGDIPSGAVVECVYDGTRFQVIGVASSLAGYLALSGGTMTGPINEAQGSNIASGATINLTTATGNYVHVTGTTTITGITLAQGAERTVVFDGALTLTNGASLILPSGVNITTAAGDTARFRGEAAGVVRCVSYTKASGAALVAPTQAVAHQQIFTSSGAFTFPAGTTASTVFKVTEVGAGGGTGAGFGNGGNTSISSGTQTITTVTAGGGTGANGTGNGAAGGSATNGDINIPGESGGSSQSNGSVDTSVAGGKGGSSLFGAGGNATKAATGVAGSGYGAGASGGGLNQGAGAGATAIKYLSGMTAGNTITVTIGAAGAGAATGAQGIAIIEWVL